MPSIRLIGADGQMVGVVQTRDALRQALELGLDLVEISPTAQPPVCRIMNFGKFMYDEERKKRQAKKKQHSQVTKEMKFHANVEEHDYQTKLNHIKEFLTKGNKVKITLTFRGRENAHRELGFAVVNRILKDCEELASVDMSPKMMGRSIIAMIGARAKT